ncbi:12274_t:CDS:2 [Entrophospora sp. SA101]|nr:12274_t:CDS:2 [Entrophospora sp. SA101]
MEKKPILTIYRCKWIVIGAFTVLLIALSVILTTGVLNDLPTITTDPTSRNSSFFALGATGFMIDPQNFVIETQTELRQVNKINDD